MGHCKNYRSKKRKFSGNRFSNPPTNYDVEHDRDTTSVTNSAMITASSSKLEGNKQIFSSATSTKDKSELFGNRIINITTLMSVFSVLCCPECYGKELCLSEDSRFGLLSNFCIKCNNCNFSKGFTSSVKDNNKNQINTLLVYALRLVGKGYTAGKKIFCMLDLPFLTKVSFRKHEMKIKQSACKAAKESMVSAANEIINLKGSTAGITSCGVTMDGTWQKRGYSSFNGCVSCISVDTGKILDIEILSHFCRICNKTSKSDSAHVCKNHQGSSSSMETIGAYRIFERSENLRKLRYTDYYGDGDCKAYEAVKNIYGDHTVTKLECIGHVQKRVGNRLRKLKKSTKGLGGKGKLTDKFIDKLQNYYGIAIRSNVGNLSNMQSAVIAAFYHCCSSSKHAMHGQCPLGSNSWCKYQKAKSLGKKYTDKAPGLPQNVINIVKPVYMQLCDKKLLRKCLHGMTQNANECLNGVLWNIVPKQNFVELQTLQLGAYIAVLQFNSGSQGVLSVLNELNINAGTFLLNGLKLFDYQRINDSRRHSLPSTKTQRKILLARRKKKGLQFEEKEGLTYECGEF